MAAERGVDELPEKATQFKLPEMEQEEWNRAIYNLTPTLCLVMSPDGIIIDCNFAYAKALGYAAKGQVIGTPLIDCADPASKESIQKIFEV
jgi:PAS domain S-box-containing protein